MTTFIIRVRHTKGTTRFQLADKSSTTIKQLKQLICTQLKDHPKVTTQQLSLNGKSNDAPLTNNASLSSLDIHHGAMLYLKIVSSAIICHSNTNNSRKRKLKEILPSNNAPPAKRARLNSNNSRNHNRNPNHSLLVHTISNNNSSTASNTSSRTKSVPQNAKLSKQKAKKRSKKKQKKKEEYLFIKSEGDQIDEIVNNYLSETNVLINILNTLKPEQQALYTKDARIEAILNDKVEITEQLEESRFTSRGKSRGKRFLIVVYSFKRKKRKEAVCCYEDDQIQEIINELMWRNVDESEKEQSFLKNKINHKNIMQLIKKHKLTVIEMAKRSPPLLWSLYHSFPNQEIENVLEKFVKTALKALRLKSREMLQNNVNIK